MIFFDGIIFRISPHGGISRIFMELWRRWEMVNTSGVAFITPDVKLPVKERLERINYSGLRPRRLFWRGEMNRAYRRVKPDIFISTYYTLSPDDKSKQIAVIPDMIDELYFNSSWSDHALISRKNKIAHQATALIAISHKTKEDILSFYQDMPESRIRVMTLAASEIFRPMLKKELARKIFPRPFILFVGRRGNYKNFSTLLQAYAGNSRIIRDFELVVIDDQPWKKEEVDIINRANLRSRIHLIHNVSDQDLVLFYQQARVFIFPSRYEGFGMPLLESAACGTPVIANASASLVEIGENAVLYFSGPDEVSSLSTQLDKICFDDALHLEYSQRGLEQSAKYSWDKFTQQFDELMGSLGL